MSVPSKGYSKNRVFLMYTRNKEKVAMTTRKDKRGKSGRNWGVKDIIEYLSYLLLYNKAP